ncbi:MAG: hypothetical protein E7616_10495 [Ruminococcaceae bacterium]|nr:hypothetical protein [Oscillospiraceae bacterium]
MPALACQLFIKSSSISLWQWAKPKADCFWCSEKHFCDFHKPTEKSPQEQDVANNYHYLSFIISFFGL